MGQLIKKSKLEYTKHPSVELDKIAVAYSLYKYAEINHIYSFRVSDFYKPSNKQGIYREFGVAKNDFLKLLHTLNSDVNRVLIAELNLGLDNITLREDFTPLDVFTLLK